MQNTKKSGDALVLNSKYAGTENGEFVKQMLAELADSDKYVSSKKPESAGDWELLHNRNESEPKDNFYCWRKNTGSKTEMFTKSIMYINRAHPVDVAKAMTVKLNMELEN